MSQKLTKKWQKEFLQRYSETIKNLQDLENEFIEMKKDNSDNYWELSFLHPENDTVNFEQAENAPNVYHTEQSEKKEENIEISFSTDLGNFNFKMTDFEKLIQFRNDLIEAMDKFNRPSKTKKVITDDCQEDEEDWENNEEVEYTIQASRTCVQSWTHTVKARSACEAYRKVKDDGDGSTHDENDSYGDYGEIDFEII